MLRLVPVAKNRSRPLCRNPLIATGISVTYAVTDHNPANLRMQPSAPPRSSAPRPMLNASQTTESQIQLIIRTPLSEIVTEMWCLLLTDTYRVPATQEACNP